MGFHKVTVWCNLFKVNWILGKVCSSSRLFVCITTPLIGTWEPRAGPKIPIMREGDTRDKKCTLQLHRRFYNNNLLNNLALPSHLLSWENIFLLDFVMSQYSEICVLTLTPAVNYQVVHSNPCGVVPQQCNLTARPVSNL